MSKSLSLEGKSPISHSEIVRLQFSILITLCTVCCPLDRPTKYHWHDSHIFLGHMFKLFICGIFKFTIIRGTTLIVITEPPSYAYPSTIYFVPRGHFWPFLGTWPKFHLLQKWSLGHYIFLAEKHTHIHVFSTNFVLIFWSISNLFTKLLKPGNSLKRFSVKSGLFASINTTPTIGI